MARVLGDGGLIMVMLGSRGVTVALARAFGVHRSTAWRDLQWIVGLSPSCDCYVRGEHVYSFTRACQSGPIISVTDPDGYEIRGAARRRILRALPRYL